jgi:hypothetical protein
MRNFSQNYMTPQNVPAAAAATSSSVAEEDKMSDDAPSAPPAYQNSDETGGSTSDNSSSSNNIAPKADEENVALLATMGFLDRDQNRRALLKWHNNVNRAVQELLSDPNF